MNLFTSGSLLCGTFSSCSPSMWWTKSKVTFLFCTLHYFVTTYKELSWKNNYVMGSFSKRHYSVCACYKKLNKVVESKWDPKEWVVEQLIWLKVARKKSSHNSSVKVKKKFVLKVVRCKNHVKVLNNSFTHCLSKTLTSTREDDVKFFLREVS